MTSAGVCVFAPSTIVTVTVERGERDGAEEEIHFHAGGQGFWIARLLARLGVPTTLCTTFGGEPGRVAAALVARENIEVRAVHRSEPTGAWIHDRRDGDRVAIADTAGAPLGRHDADELHGAALAAGLAAGVVVLAGSHRDGSVAPERYERLAADLRVNGVVVIADLAGDSLRAALTAGLDFCKVSDEDLAPVADVDETDPVECLEWLVERGAERAALTRGAEPLVSLVDGEFAQVRTPTLRVVDHRGAGDAFTAMVAAAQHWGLDWSDSIRWGAAAGSLTVTRRGLATADRREIHRMLPHIQVDPYP